MLNTFEETFEVTEMRTFKHQPFFIVGGGGVGAYSWYCTVNSIALVGPPPPPGPYSLKEKELGRTVFPRDLSPGGGGGGGACWRDRIP